MVRSLLKLTRPLFLLPAIVAIFLLIGTSLAFALAPAQITISNLSILVVFLIPAKYFGELFVEMLSLKGFYFLVAWYAFLSIIAYVSLLIFRKSRSSHTVEKNALRE